MMENFKEQMDLFTDKDFRKIFWHTSAHILAQAVKRLYPNTKLAIGPAIDDGFYYDFDIETTLQMEDLQKIEEEMKQIVAEKLPITKMEMKASEAKKLMLEKGEVYKVELIEDLEVNAENVTLYKQGESTDLCAGPHLDNTSYVKAIKLLQCTGAYWRGDSSKKMLTRIYGVSFPKESMLREHLEMLEEAKKRDHNIIGRQLKYFTTVDVVGQGLPLLMPRGAKVVQILQRYVEDLEEANGYVMTKTPLMAKSDLYKLSGHWDHYKDGMFIIGDEEKEVLALRPMTCPFQFMVYNAELHSYKDLPIRYGETSTLFRNESSGEMHGLIRVRQFTISEGHLVVTPEQVDEEFKGVVRLIKRMMTDIGLAEDLSYRLSKWDPNNKEKYIGDAEDWEKTQEQMRHILQDMNLEFEEADGEAAFYGPKLDIQIKNVHGKEDTLVTVQIDFSLGERLNMVYVDANGKKQHPYVIHRTSIGCYERTLALLLEKYAGALPLWLSPIQCKVIPISQAQHQGAQEVCEKLREKGLRVELDDRNEKMGYKIREAQLEKIPYMLIVGEKEIQDGTVSVRSRSNGDMGTMEIESLINKLRQEVDSKAR